MTQTTTFETGATSHAVNDLILFTDNTKILAERRDFIYKKYAHPDRFKPKVRNPIGTMKREFIDVLLHYAKNRYVIEFPNFEDHKHIFLTPEQENEFAELYYKEFDNWKKEHGIE